MLKTLSNFTRLAPFLAVMLIAAAPAIAQEYQPYPAPKITVEQWARYLGQIRERFGPTMEIYEDKDLVAFSDESTLTFYIFTTKDHPAHPAWITRQMVEEGGKVHVRQIGYFAGAEAPFDQLFREYLQRNEQLVEEVQRRNK